MKRKDIRIIWLPGDNYAVEGVATDIKGNPDTYYGSKLDTVLYLIKALFLFMTFNTFAGVNIIVIGHELCKDGGEAAAVPQHTEN